MNQDTPATEIRSKDLLSNCEALEECLLEIPVPEVRSVLDVRYGLGYWARLVRERFPKCRILGYEQDKGTFDNAWKDKRVRLNNKRFEGQSYRCDLVLADFNVVTALNRQPLDDLLGQGSCKYLIFTDVSVSRMHLNYQRSYGLDRPSLEEYWDKFIVEGFQLLRFSKKHYAASTGLYQRKYP